MKKKSVGTQGIYGKRLSAGIGYIIIPNDQDRKKFIIHCNNTSTVSMLTENNEYFHDVNIDSWTLQEIEWPDTNDNSHINKSF